MMPSYVNDHYSKDLDSTMNDSIMYADRKLERNDSIP
jgi:hypothetical protein